MGSAIPVSIVASPWPSSVILSSSTVITVSANVNVPSDSIICLVILIAVVISIPVSLDFYSYYREKKKQQM